MNNLTLLDDADSKVASSTKDTQWQQLLNKRNDINGIKLMNILDPDIVSCCFFDPQYRGF